MKTMLLIAALLFPIAAFAHPGKTDRHGGHKCLKGCEEWNLYYAEYHLHDKNGRPVRVNRKKPPKPPVTVIPSPAVEIPAPEAAPVPVPPPAPAAAPADPELIPFPWALVLLFLLLFLLARRRSRDRK